LTRPLRREPRIDFQTAQVARLDDLDDEALILIWADDRSNDWKSLLAKIPFVGANADTAYEVLRGRQALLRARTNAAKR